MALMTPTVRNCQMGTKEPWIYRKFEFRLLWIPSSNHCNCDSLSSLFRSDSVVFNWKTFGTVNIAVTASGTVLKIEPKFFMCLFVIISWLQHFGHYQLFFPISCWSIQFCINTYRQSTLGWLGLAGWWFITLNSIKLKVSVINNWSILLWTTLRSNSTKLPASIERMVSSFVLCPNQRLEVYNYGSSDRTLCLFYWFWIT